MSKRARRLSSILVLLAAVCGAGLWMLYPADAADRQPQVLKSQVVGWDAAQTRRFDWGEFRRYFAGQTYGTRNVLTAVAVVQPGKAVHKAHRHAEEEYLVVAEGSGTWSLAGKESAARRGDVLYVGPWVYHGLTNTGSQPLTFLVVRFSSKGVEAPPRPDDRPDEQ